jgi:hypothetical protein
VFGSPKPITEFSSLGVNSDLGIPNRGFEQEKTSRFLSEASLCDCLGNSLTSICQMLWSEVETGGNSLDLHFPYCLWLAGPSG